MTSKCTAQHGSRLQIVVLCEMADSVRGKPENKLEKNVHHSLPSPRPIQLTAIRAIFSEMEFAGKRSHHPMNRRYYWWWTRQSNGPRSNIVPYRRCHTFSPQFCCECTSLTELEDKSTIRLRSNDSWMTFLTNNILGIDYVFFGKFFVDRQRFRNVVDVNCGCL